MSQSSAWFPCYVNDLLGSMRWKTMTPAQRGAYWQLICWQMQSEDGTLPEDPTALSNLSDIDLQNGNACVLDAFPVVSPGRRANPRALKEWQKRRAISGVRSEIGSAGIAKRWKDHSKLIAIAIPVDSNCNSKPIAIGTTTTTTTTDTATTTVLPPQPPKGGEARPARRVSDSFKTWTREQFTENVKAANSDNLLTASEVEDFIGYWTEPTATGRFKLATEATWDTRRRMQTAVRVVFSKQRTGAPGIPANRFNRVAPIEFPDDHLAPTDEELDREIEIRKKNGTWKP